MPRALGRRHPLAAPRYARLPEQRDFDVHQLASGVIFALPARQPRVETGAMAPVSTQHSARGGPRRSMAGQRLEHDALIDEAQVGGGDLAKTLRPRVLWVGRC